MVIQLEGKDSGGTQTSVNNKSPQVLDGPPTFMLMPLKPVTILEKLCGARSKQCIPAYRNTYFCFDFLQRAVAERFICMLPKPYHHGLELILNEIKKNNFSPSN